MNARQTLILTAVVLGLALAGCGGGATATVSGSVDFDGHPVANGSISFLPEDGKGPVAGGTISGGRYHVDHVPPGRKIVQIIGAKKTDSPVTHEEMAAEAKARFQHGGGERPGMIPTNAEGNNVVVDAPPGQTELNFTLKTPAAKK